MPELKPFVQMYSTEATSHIFA